MFANIIIVSFVPPIMYLIDFGYLYQLLKRRYYENLGDEARITQFQANQLFEGPQLDLAQKYANLMLLFMLTVFYIPLIPITPLITGIGAFFQFWVEKYKLLRVHKQPTELGSLLTFFFTNVFSYFILLYGISNFMFITILGGSNIIGLLSLILTIINVILPFRTIINRCQNKVKRLDSDTYENHNLKFITDYDRVNPLTSEKAINEFLIKCSELKLKELLSLIKEYK
jgi:hypothetical protein